MFRTGSTSQLSSQGEAAACLVVALGCLLVGLPAAAVNHDRPGSTVLSAFVWIGGFYAVLGLLRARVRPVGDPPRIVPAAQEARPQTAPQAVDEAKSGGAGSDGTAVDETKSDGAASGGAASGEAEPPPSVA